MTGEPLPVAFRDLPAEAFPFTVELLDAGTREVVWGPVTVGGPGALKVPGQDKTGPGRKIARITWADGTVAEA
jgi:hypothetical protein